MDGPLQVLRLYLVTGNTQALFRVLSQPQKYGVFPDPYTSVLLMDHFMEQGDWASAYSHMHGSNPRPGARLVGVLLI